MGMLTFSNDPPKVYEIPRLEDHLIDELFYQEDEIGEMRHAAFMIECGLEEDPPDGPDVPPIPWDAKSAALYYTPSSTQANQRETTATTKREPPKRTSSMDDIEELESTASPSRLEPRRRLSVTKSGTLHGLRAPITEKSHSSDSIEDLKDEASSRRRAAPVVRQPKKLVKAKSGSLHGMRDAARKVQEANDRKATVAAAAAQEDSSSPQNFRNKLVVTKSGTLHGMRKAVEELNSKESPVRRKLVATKSGTLHGMRRTSVEQPALVATKDASPVMPKRNIVGRDHTTNLNGRSPTRPTPSQKLKRPERKASNSSGSDDDSLDRFDNSNSDPESDVSLDTDEDVPKNPTKKKDALPKIPFHGQPRTPIKKPIAVDKNEDGNEKQEDSKPRNRVFRNGKLVTDDGGTPDKLSSPVPTTTSRVSSVREKIVNGNATAHLLKSAQVPRTSLTKQNASPVGVPPAFQTNAAVPSLFQSGQKLSTDKVRPGKVKIPLKIKSVGGVDVPPAFRASGVGK